MPQDDAICHDDEDTDDKFRGDDDVYNDNGEYYSDLLHPVQLLKKPPTTYTWVNDFGLHKDSLFSGGNLYEERLICEYIWYTDLPEIWQFCRKLMDIRQRK